jgi:predicted peroxiredoxin
MAATAALRFVILTDDAERLRGALLLALSHAACGGEASLFFQMDAVRLLAPGTMAPRDGEHRAAGLPNLPELIAQARDAGVEMVACQSGLHLAGLEHSALAPGIVAGGPVAYLRDTAATDRLLLV